MSRQILRNNTWKRNLMGVNRQQQSRKSFHHFTRPRRASTSDIGKVRSQFYRDLSTHISQKLAAISSRNIGQAFTTTSRFPEKRRTSAGTIHASPRHASSIVARNHALLPQKATRTNPGPVTNLSKINTKEGMRHFSDFIEDASTSMIEKSGLRKNEQFVAKNDFWKEHLMSTEKQTDSVIKSTSTFQNEEILPLDMLDRDQTVKTLEDSKQKLVLLMKNFDDELNKLEMRNEQYRNHVEVFLIGSFIVLLTTMTLY